VTFDCSCRTKMAVYVRIGSIIPMFSSQVVELARSTEDLIDKDFTLLVAAGKLANNLKYEGTLYIDDFISHAYKQD